MERRRPIGRVGLVPVVPSVMLESCGVRVDGGRNGRVVCTRGIGIRGVRAVVKVAPRRAMLVPVSSWHDGDVGDEFGVRASGRLIAV